MLHMRLRTQLSLSVLSHSFLHCLHKHFLALQIEPSKATNQTHIVVCFCKVMKAIKNQYLKYFTLNDKLRCDKCFIFESLPSNKINTPVQCFDWASSKHHINRIHWGKFVHSWKKVLVEINSTQYCTSLWGYNEQHITATSFCRLRTESWYHW